MMRKILLTAAVACVLPAVAPAALIVNGGFESGLTSWVTADQIGSDGTFTAQSGTLSPVNGDAVPAPPEGVQAAMTDAGGPGSHALYQDITIPSGFTTGRITFSLFIGNRGDRFTTPSAAGLDFATAAINQQVRVDLMTTSAGVFSVAGGDILQNLYQSQPGNTLISGYNTFSVYISTVLAANQGGTIRLRFAEVDNLAPLQFGVDNVNIDGVPEPATFGLIAAGLAGMVWRRSRRS